MAEKRGDLVDPPYGGGCIPCRNRKGENTLHVKKTFFELIFDWFTYFLSSRHRNEVRPSCVVFRRHPAFGEYGDPNGRGKESQVFVQKDWSFFQTVSEIAEGSLQSDATQEREFEERTGCKCNLHSDVCVVRNPRQ